MKKIKFNGKLSLNKETIANLNDNTMNGIKGGVSESCGATQCGTCVTSCGPVCIRTIGTCKVQTCWSPCSSYEIICNTD